MAQPELTSVSTRAAEIAQQQGYGAWQQSVRINRAHDRRMRTALLLLVLLTPWPFLWMAYDSAPWQPDGGSTLGFVASGIAGLVFLGLAGFAVVGLVGSAKIGGAQAHLFADGIVIERERGDLAAFRYTDGLARYVLWREPWEGELRNRVQLWIDVEGFGKTICLDGFRPHDAAVLPVIARAFGIPDQPQEIGRLEERAPLPF